MLSRHCLHAAMPPSSLCLQHRPCVPEVLRTRSLNWKKEKGLPSWCCGPRWNSCRLRTQVSGRPGFLRGQTRTVSHRSWKLENRNAARSGNSLREPDAGFAVFPSLGTQEVTNLHHPPERGNLSNLLSFFFSIFLCFNSEACPFSLELQLFFLLLFWWPSKNNPNTKPLHHHTCLLQHLQVLMGVKLGKGYRGILSTPAPSPAWWVVSRQGHGHGRRIPASISPSPVDEGLTFYSAGVLRPQEYLVSTVSPDYQQCSFLSWSWI